MSSIDGTNAMVGASMHARELSKRRVASNTTTVETPTSPATPIAPTTPMLAAHIFSDGNMMEDLQLAAELGKTLLERNKELESNIRELRGVVDDKTQEIEYLSKQTAALREVNDSRLRIYEQLEVSIQDLEKSNQRLTAETAADKRKIRSLSGTVEGLESKCEELQRSLDDAKVPQHKELLDRGRPSARKSLLPEDSSMRRSQSCENSSQPYDDATLESCDMRARILNLEDKLKVALQERESEVKKREELEIEMACLVQENSALQEQALVFRAKETHFKSFDDEVASMDETASSKFCRKCLGTVDETGSNLTVQDLVDDLEDDLEPSFNDIQGECALVRLKNGGYAWGSQESLASMGQVVNYPGSSSTSPQTETSEAPHNSLLSELDAQYRILIEKYEALVEARERPEALPLKHNHDAHAPHTLVDSGIDEVSGPMSLVMTEVPPSADQSSMNGTCQRCSNCSCDLKPGGPKNGNLEDLSEVETSSSGFSEGESRFCTKMIQTEPVRCYCGTDDLAITPTAFGVQLLDLNSSVNPCDKRFVCQPDYRNLFHEIFEMLKKERQDIQVEKVVRRTLMQCKEFEARVSTFNLGSTDEVSTIATTTTSTCSNPPLSGDNDENKSQTVAIKQRRREKKEKKSGGKTERKEQGTDSETIVREDDLKDFTKPSRPDFLDLETASRGSSRSRRRKKSNRIRQNSGESITLEGQSAQMNNHRHDRCTKMEPNLPQLNTNSNESTAKVPPKDCPILENSSSDLSGCHPKDTKQKGPRSGSNARKVRCEHKQKKNQHKHKPPLQNKHLSNVWVQHVPYQVSQSSTNNVWANNHTGVSNSANLPSVQVAKLIKFEKSYAEVLKTKPHKDLKS